MFSVNHIFIAFIIFIIENLFTKIKIDYEYRGPKSDSNAQPTLEIRVSLNKLKKVEEARKSSKRLKKPEKVEKAWKSPKKLENVEKAEKALKDWKRLKKPEKARIGSKKLEKSKRTWKAQKGSAWFVPFYVTQNYMFRHTFQLIWTSCFKSPILRHSKVTCLDTLFSKSRVVLNSWALYFHCVPIYAAHSK